MPQPQWRPSAKGDILLSQGLFGEGERIRRTKATPVGVHLPKKVMAGPSRSQMGLVPAGDWLRPSAALAACRWCQYGGVRVLPPAIPLTPVRISR